MRAIDQIIVHCSATPPYQNIGKRELKAQHTKPKQWGGRGWSDIGYHYVIRRSGQIELGRDLDGDNQVDDDIGAHAFGWNTNSIGICLIGGINSKGESEANFTQNQMVALRAFLVAKKEQYPNARIMGHRDTGARKDCPSFDFQHWLETDELIDPVNYK